MVCTRLHSFNVLITTAPHYQQQPLLIFISPFNNSLSDITNTRSQQSDLVTTSQQEASVFVTCKQTFQEGHETVQLVANFQWHSCNRLAFKTQLLNNPKFYMCGF